MAIAIAKPCLTAVFSFTCLCSACADSATKVIDAAETGEDSDLDSDSSSNTENDDTESNTDMDSGADSDTDIDIDIMSGNPIIKHIRTADPSAHVWSDGKVWVYTSHDMDDAVDYSSMDGYHVFSSSDMVNWTDHGEILHSKDVSWAAGGDMYAPSAAYKDGVYYFYFGTMSIYNNEWQWRVGVATSDVPEGPFTDIGHFIEGTDHFHPECFVDDDGAAYLYWGGGEDAKVARLKDNMIELAEEPRLIDYGADNFGEASFMHKVGDRYYFSYNGDSDGNYSVGDNPYGPFEYKGKLLTDSHGAQEHHSILEYREKWYLFYHVGDYDGGTLHRRNVCIDYLYYNPDGTMQEVIPTSEGVDIVI